MYEVPFGVTLRELLEMAGGVADGRELQAVLFGGAAGAFATADSLDVKLTFEDLRAAGLPLGSGVVMVFDDTRDLRDVLSRLGHFFAHEFVREVLSLPDGHAAAEGNPARGWPRAGFLRVIWSACRISAGR